MKLIIHVKSFLLHFFQNLHCFFAEKYNLNWCNDHNNKIDVPAPSI